MPRKRTATKPTEPAPISEAVDQVIETARQNASPDVFDEALAAANRQAAASAAEFATQPDVSDPLVHTPNPSDSPTTEIPKQSFAERVQHGEPKNGVTRALVQPNPFAENTISLTNDNDGPKMRLYRDRRNPQIGLYENAMVIQFDEKPEEEARQKLRDNGWQWKQADAVWRKPLGENPGVEHRKAQELFEQIANDIRQGNGLEPVVSIGNAR